MPDDPLKAIEVPGNWWSKSIAKPSASALAGGGWGPRRSDAPHPQHDSAPTVRVRCGYRGGRSIPRRRSPRISRLERHTPPSAATRRNGTRAVDYPAAAATTG